MSGSFSESDIVRQLAERVCSRVTRRVIRSLQRNTDDRLSGDDSDLKNVWEEVCVQVQGEESADWSAYESTIDGLVELEVEALVSFEREAVWLQTEHAFDWNQERSAEPGPIPVLANDITRYIVDLITAQAMEWSNPRIRQYIER